MILKHDLWLHRTNLVTGVNSTMGNKVPRTLQEAILALDGILSPGDRQYLATVLDENQAAARLHNSLGRYLRNKWGFWTNSPLAEHMRVDHRIEHPDDMSHAIIVAYCRHQIPTRFQRILKECAQKVP